MNSPINKELEKNHLRCLAIKIEPNSIPQSINKKYVGILVKYGYWFHQILFYQLKPITEKQKTFINTVRNISLGKAKLEPYLNNEFIVAAVLFYGKEIRKNHNIKKTRNFRKLNTKRNSYRGVVYRSKSIEDAPVSIQKSSSKKLSKRNKTNTKTVVNNFVEPKHKDPNRHNKILPTNAVIKNAKLDPLQTKRAFDDRGDWIKIRNSRY